MRTALPSSTQPACQHAALQAEEIGRALRDSMPDHMKKYFERADFAGGALVALDPLKARPIPE